MAVTIERIEQIKVCDLNPPADCYACKDMACPHINTGTPIEERTDHPCVAILELTKDMRTQVSGRMRFIWIMKGGVNI